MKVVAIIQARMGSTRLPGKAIVDIAGRSMLARTVERAKKAKTVNAVLVATTESPDDETIVAACEALRVAVFRGSELDVLDRYYRAALSLEAGAVVRLTSDCPLLEPGEIDHVVQAFLDAQPSCDYASNVLERTYPRGLDTEVMTMAALSRSWKEAKDASEREHVTLRMRQRPEEYSVLSVKGDEDLSGHRFTVDTEEDLAFVRAVYEELGSDGGFGWREVLTLLKEKPEIREINANVEQKAVE